MTPLLDHSSVAQLTLHSIENGVETTYNTWDSLNVLGDIGKLGTSPLLIKSKNDMEVDSSPAASSFSPNKQVFQADNIDIETEQGAFKRKYGDEEAGACAERRSNCAERRSNCA